MALYLVRGRGTGRKRHNAGGRRYVTPLRLGYRTFPTLLFDARHLSQEWPATDVRSVDLTRLLRQVYRRFSPIAQRRQIFLHFEAFPQRLEVQGKPVALDWVLSILVDYALNDAPTYGEVVLTTARCADHKCRVGISCLSQNSPYKGLPTPWATDKRERSTKTRIEQHVGFSTAMMLIELHGGRIIVKTNGEGRSEVIVILPLLTKSDTR